MGETVQPVLAWRSGSFLEANVEMDVKRWWWWWVCQDV